MMAIFTIAFLSLIIVSYGWRMPQPLVRSGSLGMSVGQPAAAAKAPFEPRDLASGLKVQLDQACTGRKPKGIYLQHRRHDPAISQHLANRTIDTWSTHLNINKSLILDSSLIAESSLLIPLLDFDVDKAMDEIDNAINIPAKEFRKKPLLAISRGVGSGKTRAIEELRLSCQLLWEDCLAIPITFNAHWEYVYDEVKNIYGVELSRYQSVAISVAARMLSMFNSKTSLKDNIIIIKDIVNNYLKDLQKDDGFISKLFAGIIAHLVSVVEKSGKRIKRFVLFIDESSKVDDEFKRNKVIVNDLFKEVRQAILSIEVENIAKSALVMSSLEAKTLALTDSSRPIRIIELASKLSVDGIVDRIWIPTIRRIEGYNLEPMMTRERLVLLAAMVNTAPRVVEIINDILFVEMKEARRLDKIVMSKVLDHMFTSIRSRYETLEFPTGKYLRALIDGSVIEVDSTVEKHIRSSIYVNQILSYPREETAMTIAPVGNLVFLFSAASNAGASKKASDLIASSIIEVVDVLKNALLTDMKKGDLLEELFRKWMNVRLLSNLLDPVLNKTTLEDLFVIHTSDLFISKGQRRIDPFRVKWRKDLKCFKEYFEFFDDDALSDIGYIIEDDFFLPKRTPIKKLKIWSSSDSIDGFVRDLGKLKNDNVKMLCPIKQSDNTTILEEGFDDGLAIFLNEANKEFLVFIDEKSRNEASRESSVDVVSDWRGHFPDRNSSKPAYYQFFNMCNKQDKVSDMPDKEGAYLDAFKKGNWLFIYFTTHEGPNIFVQREDFEPSITSDSGTVYHSANSKRQYGSMLVLNRDVAKKFLAVVGNAYIALRSFS